MKKIYVALPIHKLQDKVLKLSRGWTQLSLNLEKENIKL